MRIGELVDRLVSATHIFTIIGEKTVLKITTTWDCLIGRDPAVKDFDSFRELNCLFFLDSKPVKVPGKLPPPDFRGTRFTLILLQLLFEQAKVNF